MHSPLLSQRLGLRAVVACCALLGAVACSGSADPVDPGGGAVVQAPPIQTPAPLPPSDGEIATDDAVAALDCVATPRTGAIDCTSPSPAGSSTEPSDVFGNQGSYVSLVSSNTTYVGTTFGTDVTITNLMNEAIGTPDGTVLDPNGVQVFFTLEPVATVGSGQITIDNADGRAFFTASNQPYYQYTQILHKNETSSVKRWLFTVPNSVTTFTFRVYISTYVQPLLVINEMLVNPGGTISDANGEWIELYNAGTRAVQMQGLVIADSSPAGRRPFAVISSSFVLSSGGYYTLGETTNTVNNGGVPIDYAYGSALQFANSLDAFKIARVYGTDTLTIDRTQYSNAATSAQNGISRELTNPSLDNSNMDGSNWADALVTAVYGPGGRGTPKAQNSTFAGIRFPEPSMARNAARRWVNRPGLRPLTAPHVRRSP